MCEGFRKFIIIAHYLNDHLNSLFLFTQIYIIIKSESKHIYKVIQIFIQQQRRRNRQKSIENF